MKVEIKETETKFEPITITLTIESEEELCDLWHRINLAPDVINEHITYHLKHKTSISSMEFFNKLDSEMERLKLSKA